MKNIIFFISLILFSNITIAIENRELTKEEKFRATIAEIRDLGFEIDEKNHTLSPLILLEDKTIINEDGHHYQFKFLKAENLIKLNKNSHEPYLLKLENPIGLDFIINYKSAIEKENNIYGYLKNISLENGSKIKSIVDLNYYTNVFKADISLDKNGYMPDFDFIYKNKIKKGTKERIDGVIELRIDIDILTGKKIYHRPIIDM